MRVMCYSKTRLIERRWHELQAHAVRAQGNDANSHGGGRASGHSGTGTSRPGWQRVGDREREEVMHVLADAFAEGRLTREEFDDRSARALAARTGADLASLTEDLPLHGRVDRGLEVVPRQRPLAKRVRVEAQTYFAVMLLLMAVWFVAGLTSQAWYPWFIWPAMGWGIGIASRAWRAARYHVT
jgi:hypothetical protein